MKEPPGKTVYALASGAPRSVRYSRGLLAGIFALMLASLWLVSIGSRPVHADENAGPTTVLTASATPEQVVPVEASPVDRANEAPMPTEVSGGTVTPQSTSSRPTETHTQVPG